MTKWNVSIGLELSIAYDDIEADSKDEAIQIAQARALEDVDWNNCECDVDNSIVYSCWEENDDN